jgi:hypothetical protein
MEAWYPPGHGDFYQAFANSGLLEEFIGQVPYVQYCMRPEEISGSVCVTVNWSLYEEGRGGGCCLSAYP